MFSLIQKDIKILFEKMSSLKMKYEANAFEMEQLKLKMGKKKLVDKLSKEEESLPSILQ